MPGLFTAGRRGFQPRTAGLCRFADDENSVAHPSSSSSSSGANTTKEVPNKAVWKIQTEWPASEESAFSSPKNRKPVLSKYGDLNRLLLVRGDEKQEQSPYLVALSETGHLLAYFFCIPKC